MKISNENKKNFFLSFWLLVLLIIIIKYMVIEPNKLKENYRYTIAEIDEIGIDAEGAFFAGIRYYVKNKHYSNSFLLQMEERKKYKVGDKYFIKYYPPDPDNAKVELNLVVPKSIKVVPLDGWKELPINSDTQE